VNTRLLVCTALAGFSVFGQTAVLTPTPVSITFTWQSGNALPAGQALAVKSGSSTAVYTTSVTPSNALWLTVSPDTGKLPAPLTVRVNPTGLPVGTFNASVRVTATGFASPVLIPVTLTITAPLPTLSVSSTTLSFTAPPAPPTQTLQLIASGGPVSFTAALQGATWASVTPANGVALPGVPATLTISADATGLDPQAAAYAGKLVITASGVPTTNKTQNISISLLVNASTPTITSLWPSAAKVGSSLLTTTIRGTGFYKGTTVKVSGSVTPLKTTFISASTLLVDLPATLLATATALNIVATNPAPGGDSAASPFVVSNTPVVQAVVSSASYASGAVGLGELVSLFGEGIGPANPASFTISNGYVTQTLANTSVTIDGKGAAMVYVSNDMITVQVPYDASIGTQRNVVVNNNGTLGQGKVDIVAAAPALFTLDGSGIGQAAALTFNMQTSLLSLNSATSPLHVGDIAVLYLTGEGDYYTAVTPRNGYVIPANLNPLPQLNPLPVVTIGGTAATVQYAGPLPGGMLGVMQINAVVPAGITVGSAVPVTVTVGSAVSQPGVTLTLK
jgi:trimeric autotransporter adhesin